MTISVPNLYLVVLIGPTGSGKSTCARKHFRLPEVLSSGVHRRPLCGRGRQGFPYVPGLDSPEDGEAATVEPVRLWNDKRQEHGPCDVIGDLHGCCDELETLHQQLGYRAATLETDSPVWGNR